MNPLNFEEHRRGREENEYLVRCVRCGKLIPATSNRCPECRVHFQGEAQDFLHPDEQPTQSRLSWFVWIAVIVVTAMVFSSLVWR